MRTLFALPVLLIATAAHAQPVSCPLTIDVAPQKLVKEMQGWELFTDTVNTRYQLEGADVYSGKPEELASLVPDENNVTYAQWNLAENGKQIYYLSCRYTQTSLRLTKKLPAAFTSCRVDYETNVSISGNPSPQNVSCE